VSFSRNREWLLEKAPMLARIGGGGRTTRPFPCSIVAFLPYDLTRFPGELGIFSVDTRDRFA
jgi:hypothetical protein